MWVVACAAAVSLVVGCFSHEETLSHLDESQFSKAREVRYLLYDVNPGEGFNLRRDVYMRVANLVRQLPDDDVVLVLPPWGGLYHWQSKDIGNQLAIPWSTFFDLESLNRFIPVIEFDSFSKSTNGNGGATIDLIYYLQRYSEGWQNGEWKERWDIRPCIEADKYYQQDVDGWRGWFWGMGDAVVATRLECVSIQGQSNTLVSVLQRKETVNLQSVMVDRAETVLHDYFGDKYYWQARRSMRYSKELIEIGDDFRRQQLQSDDSADATVLGDDWRNVEKKPGDAVGGPYLAVHWRRKDFVRAHGKELPSVNGTAQQIIKLLQQLQLHTVFLATDAPQREVNALQAALTDGIELKQFVPSREVKEKYKDGGVSIVDQWICAHARHFTGSYSSTFSFRIQEDREILGFAPVSTFNRLCPDNNADCEQPVKWTILYS